MCAVTPTAQLTLPMDGHAAARARAFLRQGLCPAHGIALIDDAQLLISELVTNAVRHGAPPLTLQLTCDESTGMTARVSDNDPALPTCTAASDQAESGRGMALVDLISDAWGVEPAPPGKAVWFRLLTQRT